MFDQLSNLHLNFYYGSRIRLDEHWGEKNAVCPYSKLYYILDGECEFVIAGTVYRAAPGDLYLIPAGTKHSFYHVNQNYIEKYWFHFDATVGGRSLFDLAKPPYVHHFGIDAAVADLFQSILTSAADDTLGAQLLLNAKMLELLSLYFCATGTEGAAAGADEALARVLTYIGDHLDRTLSVGELAELVHFHPNYFVRFFKERMGVPPVRYINNVKTERAKSLLENTSLPIKEIMAQVGFSDYSHFSKFFKAYCGYSPTAFRSYYTKPE